MGASGTNELDAAILDSTLCQFLEYVGNDISYPCDASLIVKDYNYVVLSPGKLSEGR